MRLMAFDLMLLIGFISFPSLATAEGDRFLPRSDLAGAAQEAGPEGGQRLVRERGSGSTSSFGELPLHFVANHGQWKTPAQFVALRDGLTACFERDAIVLQLTGKEEEQAGRGILVRLLFENALDATTLLGEGAPCSHFNYFVGTNPRDWHTRVPAYRRILYQGLYPGIDVRVREESHRLEYDVLLEPDADLSQLVIRCDGIDDLTIQSDGALVIETALGTIRQEVPKTWTQSPTGEQKPVACRYRKIDQRRYGFEAPERDPSQALVIDPGLIYSTYLGGAGFDFVWNMAADGSDEMVVVGVTQALDFPATAGAYDKSHNGGTDAFVTRLGADGDSLIWSTFLGSPGDDRAYNLVVDSSGDVTVSGRTDSAEFPTTSGAHDEAYNGGVDAFVTRLDSTGATLLYSTYLGGTGDDWAAALALGPGGDVVAAGYTESSDFPVTQGAFDKSISGLRDAFVTRLNTAGSDLVYSTFLGGSGDEGFSAGYEWDAPTMGVAVEPSGAATVVGITRCCGFPTTSGAYDESFNGNTDAFVTRLDPTGSSLLYSTFLGSNNHEGACVVVVDPLGRATIGGYTYSTMFPTTPGAFDETANGGGDGFLSRLDPSGGELLYSTFLGGSDFESVEAIALDGAQDPILTGICGVGFPMTDDAYDPTYNGGGDAYLTRLCLHETAAECLVYSTFLGGTGSEFGVALILNSETVATIAGHTNSTGFPTTPGAYDTSYEGPADGFITRAELPPQPTEVEDDRIDLPQSAWLGPVLPNPTRGRVSYSVGLSRPGNVQVRLFDVNGRLIRHLVDAALPTGSHELSLDLNDEKTPVPAGIYYLRLNRDGFEQTRKVVFIP